MQASEFIGREIANSVTYQHNKGYVAKSKLNGVSPFQEEEMTAEEEKTFGIRRKVSHGFLLLPIFIKCKGQTEYVKVAGIVEFDKLTKKSIRILSSTKPIVRIFKNHNDKIVKVSVIKNRHIFDQNKITALALCLFGKDECDMAQFDRAYRLYFTNFKMRELDVPLVYSEMGLDQDLKAQLKEKEELGARDWRRSRSPSVSSASSPVFDSLHIGRRNTVCSGESVEQLQRTDNIQSEKDASPAPIPPQPVRLTGKSAECLIS